MDEWEKYINELQNSLKTTKGSEEKALIQPKGCGRKLKWDEMEDVTDYVLDELKKVGDNNLGVILDIMMWITMELTRNKKCKAQNELNDDVLTVVGRPGTKMKDWDMEYFEKQ